MKIKLFIALFCFVLLSCSPKKRFPEKVTQMVEGNEQVASSDIPASSNPDILFLSQMIKKYNLHSPEFNLEKFKKSWSKVGSLSELTKPALMIWVRATELLFELSGDAIYAEKLEQAEPLLVETPEVLEGFVITKYIDHLHVNLFEPAEIKYQHSLGGEVDFLIDTKEMESGKVLLHFKMTERRYIELFIRIPSWAEGTTVTVKKVKYFAPPGDYCKIAKRWKDGDVVEIILPKNKIPV